VAQATFNQRLAGEMKIDYSFTSQAGSAAQLQGSLRIAEKVYELAGFSGAYLRLMDYLDLPEYQDQAPELPTAQAGENPTQAAGSIALLHHALTDWLEIAPLRVMNRLSAMGSNQSKPYQAQIIAEAGFLIPPTLITNDPQQVQDFVKTHGRVVYKSISAVRSIVGELDRPRLHELEKTRYLPTQFQAFIPGENLRVHVAGERLFATRILTPAVDYRYAGQAGLEVDLTATELDESLSRRCRSLSQSLELPLCGIDLKITPAGEVYCFEVNPSPAFSYYQEQTGQDIAAAIVEYLIN
jgi:glutathione synthase/RimK-type ligase-like ATP-grasp enzyme